MHSTSSVNLSRSVINRAKIALFITFFTFGFAFASWAARIPLVMASLSINSAVMGVLLLCLAVGSLITMLSSGWVTTRFRCSTIVFWASSIFAFGLMLVGLAVAFKILWLTGLGLFIFGLGSGCCDVAMNLEGVNVERALKQTIMPRLHAFFSMGNVGGALFAVILEYFHFSFSGPLFVLVLIMWLTLILCSRRYLPVTANKQDEHKDNAKNRPNPLAAWLEPRTLLIGFVVLSFGLIEGSAFDWLALGVITGFEIDGQPPVNWLGSLALALFVIGMTSMRWLGGSLIDKYGRVKILRICSLFSAVGLLIFGLVPYLSIAIIGVVLWGIGGALGFPVGVSAASDEPRHAAARIAVVAAVGYCAMLAGPPVLGFLALHLGVKNALLMLIIPLTISFFLIPQMKRRQPDNSDSE